MGLLKGRAGSILLVSCYELGHQPAGITMPMGFLMRDGFEAVSLDLSIEGFHPEKAERARFIGISVPMHTALRLGVRLAEEVRKINSDCHICFYGLYAHLNSEYLLDTVADSIISGEFEQSLLSIIKAIDAGELLDNLDNIEGVSIGSKKRDPVLKRLHFPVPYRNGLPPLEKYAMLEYKGGRRLAGYIEASRGCLHNCTHCPIPPVYKGRFFVVPSDVVIEDIRRLVESEVRHITFGDPDFLNGPNHSLRIVRLLHQEFPDLTFDFTAKIEHIIKHKSLFPEFARLGCLFVVSAVESFSDEVLSRLDKGHTKEDIFTALEIVRATGITLRPSFVSFTPWTTIEDYLEMLDFIESEGLIEQVDPVQYAIRLLVPPGSILLSLKETERWIGQLRQETFTYEWAHSDPRLDELQRQVSMLVEQDVSKNVDLTATFYKIRNLVCKIAGIDMCEKEISGLSTPEFRPPRLTEAWFC
jgi:radical SAM superfamily enzyme YgiQ (UPF0313 family)